MIQCRQTTDIVQFQIIAVHVTPQAATEGKSPGFNNHHHSKTLILISSCTWLLKRATAEATKQPCRRQLQLHYLLLC